MELCACRSLEIASPSLRPTDVAGLPMLKRWSGRLHANCSRLFRLSQYVRPRGQSMRNHHFPVLPGRLQGLARTSHRDTRLGTPLQLSVRVLSLFTAVRAVPSVAELPYASYQGKEDSKAGAGPYGFLAGEEVGRTPGASLNNCIRDRIQALHWTQEHNGAFGGDPSAVTLGGVSCGASSLTILLTTYEGRNSTLISTYNAVAAEEPWSLSLFTPSQMQVVYNNFTRLANCFRECSRQCLHNRSSAELQNVSSKGLLKAAYMACDT